MLSAGMTALVASPLSYRIVSISLATKDLRVWALGRGMARHGRARC